jgi:hypothetical protein
MLEVDSPANSHQQALEMDVMQQVAMTADKRWAIVRKLQRRIYDPNPAPLRPRRKVSTTMMTFKPPDAPADLLRKT